MDVRRVLRSRSFSRAGGGVELDGEDFFALLESGSWEFHLQLFFIHTH